MNTTELISLDKREEGDTVSRDYILSYLPNNLSILIKGKKKIIYNGKNLKVAYLVDIVHTLIRKHYHISDNIFNLDSRILREKYGTYYNYYIKYLIERDIIKMVSDYCVGKKCRTYMILPDSLKGVVTVRNRDRILLRKYRGFLTIAYLRKLNYELIPLDIMTQVVQNLSRVTIDYDSSMEYIESLKLTKSRYVRNVHSVKCIEHRDIWYRFDRYGRFHSNLTTLRSGIRNNYLFIDNEPTVEIDITNSQPIFLTHLMSDYLDEIDIEEYTFFKDLVVGGKFYEYVSNNTDISDRNDIKKLIYTVFFGTNHLGNKENKLFHKLFPSIFTFIRKYKKDNGDYKTLAYELQKSESNLLFNFIIRDIMDEFPGLPFFTVHDSITVKYSDYTKVKKIFNKNMKYIHDSL